MNCSLVLAVLCACLPFIDGQTSKCTEEISNNFKTRTKKLLDLPEFTKEKAKALLDCYQENGRLQKEVLKSCGLTVTDDAKKTFTDFVKKDNFNELFCCARDSSSKKNPLTPEKAKKITPDCLKKVFQLTCTDEMFQEFRQKTFPNCDKITEEQASDVFACLKSKNFVSQNSIEESLKENGGDPEYEFKNLGCDDSKKAKAIFCSMLSKTVVMEPKYVVKKTVQKLYKKCGKLGQGKPKEYCKKSDFLAFYNTIMKPCMTETLTDQQLSDLMKCQQKKGLMLTASIDTCNFKFYNEFNSTKTIKEKLCDFQDGREFATCVCNEDVKKKKDLKSLKKRRDIFQKCAKEVLGSSGVAKDKDAENIAKIFKKHCADLDEQSAMKIYMTCNPKGVFDYQGVMFCSAAMDNPVTSYSAMYKPFCGKSSVYRDYYDCWAEYDYQMDKDKKTSEKREKIIGECVGVGFPPEVVIPEAPRIVAFFNKDTCAELKKNNATEKVDKCLAEASYTTPDDVKKCSKKFGENYKHFVEALCSKSKNKEKIVSCIANKAIRRNQGYDDEKQRESVTMACAAAYMDFKCNNKLAQEILKANPDIAKYTAEKCQETLKCYEENDYISMEHLKACNTKKKVDLSTPQAVCKALSSPNKELEAVFCCSAEKATVKDPSYKSDSGRQWVYDHCAEKEEEKKK